MNCDVTEVDGFDPPNVTRPYFPLQKVGREIVTEYEARDEG